MQHGDLSNQPAPRIYVVFDEAIGKIKDEDRQEFMELTAGTEYYKAVNLVELNIPLLKKIQYLSMRKNMNVYLVTWMGQGMAEAIEAFMDDAYVPVRGCLSLTPGQLARMTAQDESVIGIYDPDPNHALTYGSKGVVLKDERQLG